MPFSPSCREVSVSFHSALKQILWLFLYRNENSLYKMKEIEELVYKSHLSDMTHGFDLTESVNRSEVVNWHMQALI